MTTYDERITTYFGDAVLRAGFMPVPHLLMRHYRALDLQSEHAMFLLQLMEITWDLAQPPATMRKIAERMGISVRTAQRYSEHLVARGLVVVYEQFQDGAQVENGFDLAPLFRALAGFAPEPRPGGTPRERRRRLGSAALELAALPHLEAAPPAPDGAGPPDSRVTPPPDSHVIPSLDVPVTLPRDSAVIPGGDSTIAPPHDPADTPATTPLSWLNGVQELGKKHQDRSGAVQPSPASRTRAAAPKVSPAATDSRGWSLRWRRELAETDITRSRQLLDQLGLHAPVARACAGTLAPAEVLALAAYARAAGLGVGWIATQIYDFERRTPRAADLAPRWDSVGERLAALDSAAADRLLELVDRHAPDAPAALAADGWYGEQAAPVHAAAGALWALMHDVRGGSAATRTLRPPDGEAEAACDAGLWRAVLARVRDEVAAPDYETWLAPARLLVLDDERAVVGTDNVFAREHLQQAHGAALARAFAAELGRPTRVDVVIG